MSAPEWPRIADEALVESLIPALQDAIADVCARHAGMEPDAASIPLPAPDLCNVLLMLLATLLGKAPECATPRGVRLMGEAAGRELALLIRDARALEAAVDGPSGTA